MIDTSIIKEFEGRRLAAYKDSGGVWTIGYGTIRYPNGEAVKPGETCTPEEAEAWFNIEVNNKFFELVSLLEVSLNDNQLSALLSFVYNVGTGAFAKSTMLKLINQGKFGQASDEFPKWCKDNGKTVQGLLNRRLKEQKLFLKPV